MTFLPCRDRGFIRFVSERTDETLFEIKMIDGAIIVWGAHYRPNEFEACLTEDGATVVVAGILRDRFGVVVMFRNHLSVSASFRVELGRLAANFDPEPGSHLTAGSRSARSPSRRASAPAQRRPRQALATRPH